jgi:hypothetical protein
VGGGAGSAFLGLPSDGGSIAMDCVGCGSMAVTELPDLTAQGYRRFRCWDCSKQFNERSDGVVASENLIRADADAAMRYPLCSDNQDDIASQRTGRVSVSTNATPKIQPRPGGNGGGRYGTFSVLTQGDPRGSARAVDRKEATTSGPRPRGSRISS